MTQAQHSTHRQQPANQHEASASAVDKVKEGASKAITSAKDAANDAGRRASESIETSPLAVLAGGVALGVLIGAALPRLAREQELLDPVGQKLAGTAKDAVDAAKQRGREELDALGLSRAAAKVQAGKLMEGLLTALTAAAAAAAKVNGAKPDAEGAGTQPTQAAGAA